MQVAFFTNKQNCLRQIGSYSNNFLLLLPLILTNHAW